MNEPVAQRLAAKHRLVNAPPLAVWPNGEIADSMGKQTDLNIWTVAVYPGPCSCVCCTHLIRIRGNRAREQCLGISVL